MRNAYVIIGVLFHLSLALTMRLGIFPWAMLACFPAFFRPDELTRAKARPSGAVIGNENSTPALGK